MTKLLDEAPERVGKVSPGIKDATARLMLDMIGGGEQMPDEHRAAVLEGEAHADRGEFATDEEVAAAFRRFDR